MNTQDYRPDPFFADLFKRYEDHFASECQKGKNREATAHKFLMHRVDGIARIMSGCPDDDQIEKDLRAVKALIKNFIGAYQAKSKN